MSSQTDRNLGSPFIYRFATVYANTRGISIPPLLLALAAIAVVGFLVVNYLLSLVKLESTNKVRKNITTGGGITT